MSEMATWGWHLNIRMLHTTWPLTYRDRNAQENHKCLDSLSIRSKVNTKEHKEPLKVVPLCLRRGCMRQEDSASLNKRGVVGAEFRRLCEIQNDSRCCSPSRFVQPPAGLVQSAELPKDDLLLVWPPLHTDKTKKCIVNNRSCWHSFWLTTVGLLIQMSNTRPVCPVCFFIQ